MNLNNYEVLRETKACYEYFNDILNNCGFKLNQNIVQGIKRSILVLEDLYNITYTKIKEKEKEQLQTDLECPHCSNNVVISDLIDYAYLCNECDENLYLGEGDLNYEWYFESDKLSKLRESFLLEIGFDKDEKQVYIGTEDSSGAEYDCSTNVELKNAINSYIENYLIDDEIDKDGYSIKIWETENDRNLGESFEYLKTFNSVNDAIQEAKKLISREGYACVEVIKEDDELTIFYTDGTNEEYINHNQYANEIYKVDYDFLHEYIDNWSNKKDLNCDYDLLYCETDGIYIAIDNTKGECYTEEFSTEDQAVLWLNTSLSPEEIKKSIIPNGIRKVVINKIKKEKEFGESDEL